MCNFNGYFWNFTQNILLTHWNICFFYIQCWKFTSSHIYELLCIFYMPPWSQVVTKTICTERVKPFKIWKYYSPLIQVTIYLALIYRCNILSRRFTGIYSNEIGNVCLHLISLLTSLPVAEDDIKLLTLTFRLGIIIKPSFEPLSAVCLFFVFLRRFEIHCNSYPF